MKDDRGIKDSDTYGDNADSIPVLSKGKYWKMMAAGYVLLNAAYLLSSRLSAVFRELVLGMQLENFSIFSKFIYLLFCPGNNYLFVFPLLLGVSLYLAHKFCRKQRLLNYLLPIILLSVSIAFLISTLILWGFLSPLTQLCSGIK